MEETTRKNMTPAHNAKILSTGIAIASTLGISTAYAIQANAQILEKIQAAQTTIPTDPALVATTQAIAPTSPSSATPIKGKNKNGTTTTQPIAGIAPVTTDGTTTSTGAPAISTNAPAGNTPAVQAPVAQAPATNAPPTNPPATNPPATTPVATNPPATIPLTPPTTAPKTSASK